MHTPIRTLIQPEGTRCRMSSFICLDSVISTANNVLNLHSSFFTSGSKYLLYLVWEISTYNPLLIPPHVRWPLRLGISAFVFLSAGVWFKMLYLGISITGSTLVLVGVTGWCTDLTHDSTEGRVTIPVQKDIITGFKIFLISECMIFFCCFWGFIHMGLLPIILRLTSPYY